MGFEQPISARRLLHSSPASPPGFAWKGAGSAAPQAARGRQGEEGEGGRGRRLPQPACQPLRNLCIPSRSNRSHHTPFRRKWVNSTKTMIFFFFKLNIDLLFLVRAAELRKGREKPLRWWGGAGQSGWFRATVLLVFQETGGAGVGVSLFSRSSARFSPTPASPVLLPNLSLPLAPLPPQVPVLAHPFLTLSRQEVGRRKALSSKPSLLPRSLLF